MSRDGNSATYTKAAANDEYLVEFAEQHVSEYGPHPCVRPNPGRDAALRDAGCSYPDGRQFHGLKAGPYQAVLPMQRPFYETSFPAIQ
ncbi:MAG: hypothetical protein ACLP5H_13530 [Desulfomonilaceae bacterium]